MWVVLISTRSEVSNSSGDSFLRPVQVEVTILELSMFTSFQILDFLQFVPCNLRSINLNAM